MSRREVTIEKADETFAKSMEITLFVGLAIIIIGFILYLVGATPPYVSLKEIIKHWSENAAKFWKDVRGFVPTNYNWIFGNLRCGDIISLFGVMLLSIGLVAALFATLAAYAKERDKTMIIVVIIVLALTFFAAFQPYLKVV